jgi:hypothetical protein
MLDAVPHCREEGHMAEAISGAAGLTEDDTFHWAPDFWNVTFDVYPNPRAVTTDVMLVQALLVAYFSQPAGIRLDLKARAWSVITSLGKRFDDGIYGDATREVIRLFEEDMSAPFKDGIVRRVPLLNVALGAGTKLTKLNFAWNMTMLSDTLGTTKQETGRKALQPALYRELYGRE